MREQLDAGDRGQDERRRDLTEQRDREIQEADPRAIELPAELFPSPKPRIINILQELIDDSDVRTIGICRDEDPAKAGPYMVTTTPVAGTRPYAWHDTWAPTLGEAVQVALRYHQAPRPQEGPETDPRAPD